MDYRNERDALRGRVEQLEQELSEARQELADARRRGAEAAAEGSRADAEQLAGLEAAMPEAEALIRRRRELSAVEGMHEGRRPAAEVQPGVDGGREVPAPIPALPSRRRWAGALALVVVAAIVGCIVLVQRYRVHQSEQRALRNFQTCKEALTCCLRNHSLGGSECEWAVRGCDDYVRQANCESRPAPIGAVWAGKVRASWRGRLLSAAGNAPPTGTECMVDAIFDGSEADMRLTLAQVACGGKPQFTAPRPLMLDVASDADSMRGKPTHLFLDHLEYEETASDMNTQGRSAVAIALKRGAVWRDGSLPSPVEVALHKVGDSYLTVDEAVLDGGSP